VRSQPDGWGRDGNEENCLSKRQKGQVMPLVKSPSKEAFRKNVKAEIASNKPVKQAVAIAYAVKREAAKKPTMKTKK
jgi:hypothetical protein